MNTQDKFIAAALRLFAEKGFYGTSMDRIAQEVGMTKQALIHHFRTKEKLYGAVLQLISDRLLQILRDSDASTLEPSQDRFSVAIQLIYQHMQHHTDDSQLLLRELLDNRRRASAAEAWYLRPFLNELRQRLSLSPAWRAAAPDQQATHVYQLIGAMHYFIVSSTTLAHMYGPETVEGMKTHFSAQLRQLAQTPPPIE